jgi:acyl carrier protein
MRREFRLDNEVEIQLMNNERLAEIETFILDYLREQAGVAKALDSETNFVDSGLLDSFAILSLIMTLESRFSVKFQPPELADPAMRTVGVLAQTVCAKLA